MVSKCKLLPSLQRLMYSQQTGTSISLYWLEMRKMNQHLSLLCIMCEVQVLAPRFIIISSIWCTWTLTYNLVSRCQEVVTVLTICKIRLRLYSTLSALTILTHAWSTFWTNLMTASLRPINSFPAVSSIPQRIWIILLCKRNRLVIAHWIIWLHKWWIPNHTSSISATESISMPLVVIRQLRARLGLVFQTSGRRFFSRKVAHLKLLECLQAVITLVYFGHKLTVHLMELAALLWSLQESESSREMIKTS